MAYLEEELTDKIIGSFYEVYNDLGYGFLENVYENALYLELGKIGLQCEKQKPITVYYKDTEVGKYYADLVIEQKVIIELKAVNKLISQHELQLINYLKATNIEVGLLLNFGEKPEIKRKIYTNNRKG